MGRCTRRYLSEICEEPVYRFGGAGTVFFARYESRLFCVTSRHVLEGSNRARIRIEESDGSFRFLTPRGWWTQRERSVDFKDLSIGEVAADAAALAQIDAIQLDHATIHAGISALNRDSELVVIGFPSELQDIDYDQRVITNHRILLNARYRGQSFEGHRWVHGLETINRAGLKSLDGLSGSPVMGRMARGRWGLAGVAILGYVGMHFVESSILLEMARRTCLGDWVIDCSSGTTPERRGSSENPG
jgi:hypothetical protein